MSTDNTNGTDRRRSRRDLKELAKLAAEMPRTPPAIEAVHAGTATKDSTPPPGSSARFSVPAISIPAPPIAPRVSITVTEVSDVAAAGAPRSKWRAAIVGACVGVTVSAIGIGVLVVRRDAARIGASTRTSPAATSVVVDAASAIAARAARASRADIAPVAPVAPATTTPAKAEVATSPSAPKPIASTPAPRKSAAAIAKPAATPSTPTLAAPPAAPAPKSDLADLMRAAVTSKK